MMPFVCRKGHGEMVEYQDLLFCTGGCKVCDEIPFQEKFLSIFSETASPVSSRVSGKTGWMFIKGLHNSDGGLTMKREIDYLIQEILQVRMEFQQAASPISQYPNTPRRPYTLYFSKP